MNMLTRVLARRDLVLSASVEDATLLHRGGSVHVREPRFPVAKHVKHTHGVPRGVRRLRERLRRAVSRYGF